ncbi:MAG: hypothetical protein LH609_03145 [Rudanella sp.]|nr:hypothetical protein [Rudanella sp.]
MESAPEEELESLALWLGKTLTPIGLIKALLSIRYQLMDFMEKPGETGTDDDGKASGEPYNHLLTCISVVSKHIICGLPAYDKEEWFISD